MSKLILSLLLIVLTACFSAAQSDEQIARLVLYKVIFSRSHLAILDDVITFFFLCCSPLQLTLLSREKILLSVIKFSTLVKLLQLTLKLWTNMIQPGSLFLASLVFVLCHLLLQFRRSCQRKCGRRCVVLFRKHCSR